MMTEQEKQQLSRDVAAKYGIVPNTGMEYCDEKAKPLGVYSGGKWLHDDSARCFDLAAEHGVEIQEAHDNTYCSAWCVACPDTNKHIKVENYYDYIGDRPLTRRIAVLRALLSKGE